MRVIDEKLMRRKNDFNVNYYGYKHIGFAKHLPDNLLYLNHLIESFLDKVFKVLGYSVTLTQKFKTLSTTLSH